MFGSSMIEVAVGLTFFYVLLSLICSTVNEWIVMLLKLRSKNLEKGIKALLEDTTTRDLAERVYDHPLITGLARKGYKPSYISSKNFTRVLLDVIKQTDTEKLEETAAELKKNIERMKESKLKQSLLLLVNEAGGNVLQARRNIELWYDESMERVSGWYKRKVRLVILAIALVVSVSMNADTFHIANTLYHDSDLRASVVRLADERSNELRQVSPDSTEISTLMAEVKATQLPIGWTRGELKIKRTDGKSATIWDYIGKWGLKILGLLFTTFAASLGAPFWFDMLNKFNSLRGSGSRPKTAEESLQQAEPKKD